jgi:putative transposase
VWQRNYYEHVIRGESELNDVRQYIANNPAGWETDENNPRAPAKPGTISTNL